MRVIDFHCDTVSKLMEDKSSSLKRNVFSVDIEKLKRAKSLAQFFALFVDMKEQGDPFSTAMSMLERIKKEIKDNCNDIALASTVSDIKKNDEEGKISAFISIEEGGVLKGCRDKLNIFYNEGVRLITLTWNYPNEIGFPNHNYKYTNDGLTSFGKAVVEEMKALRMLVDVSHLSDAGFYDTAHICKGAFVASHSNARAITEHPRNLTDDMIRILAEQGGIMGLNFCSSFLGKSAVSTVDEMLAHIKHIYNIGGIEIISLGTDFDGISNKVEIEDISEIDKLAAALSKNKFTQYEIEKIFYRNALRVIKENL
jgi:membrane dipeptidase